GVSAVTTVTGHRGHSAQIRCPYESRYETNMKYLCREECSTLPWGKKGIPVQSGSTAKDQRFSLVDDTAARVFTITITDLRPEDGGTYWCGIQRPYSVTDLYTEVLLQVKQDPPPSVSSSTYPPPSSVQTQPTRPRPLTPTDIRSSVTPRRDAGGDIEIPARVLRECADQMTDVFTDIFNISLSSATVPTCLKATTIIPMPKKSSVSCLNDYRPVALTPIIMKCL
ncbi:hypothetical protein NFI96_008375, partial [Prochilodus magdalenae]